MNNEEAARTNSYQERPKVSSLEDDIPSEFAQGNLSKLALIQEARKDRYLNHSMRMDMFSNFFLVTSFIAGALLFCFAEKGETIGTALMTGPTAAFIDRKATATAAIRRREENGE